MRRQILARCADIEPRGILFEGRKEIVEPSLLKAVFKGARPSAEFFHIVAHCGDAIGMGGGGFLQMDHNLVDSVPRNEVAQRFLARDDTNRLAFIFGDVVAEQFLLLEARGEEMDVIEDGVATSASAKTDANWGSHTRSASHAPVGRFPKWRST